MIVEGKIFFSKSSTTIREEEIEIREQKGRGDGWWVLLGK